MNHYCYYYYAYFTPNPKPAYLPRLGHMRV